MIYHKVMEMEKNIIFSSLKNLDDWNIVSKAILAAIYYQNTEFAGSVVYFGLKNIIGPSRKYMINLVSTFIATHQTDYLINYFIKEMSKFHLLEIEDVAAATFEIENLKFYKKRFKGNSSNFSKTPIEL